MKLRFMIVLLTTLFLLDYFDDELLLFFGLQLEEVAEEILDAILFFSIALMFVLTFVTASNMIQLLKKSEERYRDLAYHDTLTGLPNRRMFEERLNDAMNVQQYEKNVAVLYIDLDGFKQINDSFGHGSGDILLQEVANRLKSCVREKDTLSRLAGDEFSILLPSVTRKEVILVAERIIHQFGAPFLLADSKVTITPSIGIAFSEHNEDRPETLITHADSAMYQVKHEGKNNYRIYDKDA